MATYEQSIFDSGTGLEADTLLANADFCTSSVIGTYTHTPNSPANSHVADPLDKESKICFGAVGGISLLSRSTNNYHRSQKDE